MAETTKEQTSPESPPAVGTFITLADGQHPVHADCKEARKQFERWLRLRALKYVDDQLAEKTITKEQYADQWQQTMKEGRSGEYSYGSKAFAQWRQCTDEGIAQDLFIRVQLADVKSTVTISDIENWVDKNGWQAAHDVRSTADGFAPK